MVAAKGKINDELCLYFETQIVKMVFPKGFSLSKLVMVDAKRKISDELCGEQPNYTDYLRLYMNNGT